MRGAIESREGWWAARSPVGPSQKRIPCILQGSLYSFVMTDDNAVSALAALAHNDRLRAFRTLVRAGPNGMASGEIADQLQVPPTRMSFHLASLERAGLLRSWRDGRRILYAASYDDMRRLLAFLTEDCCSGNPEICGELAPLAALCSSDDCG